MDAETLLRPRVGSLITYMPLADCRQMLGVFGGPGEGPARAVVGADPDLSAHEHHRAVVAGALDLHEVDGIGAVVGLGLGPGVVVLGLVGAGKSASSVV